MPSLVEGPGKAAFSWDRLLEHPPGLTEERFLLSCLRLRHRQQQASIQPLALVPRFLPLLCRAALWLPTRLWTQLAQMACHFSFSKKAAAQPGRVADAVGLENHQFHTSHFHRCQVLT